MKALASALVGCVLTAVVAQQVPNRGSLLEDDGADARDGARSALEPLPAGKSIESLVHAYYAYRIESAKRQAFSRSLGRMTLVRHASTILGTLEVAPTAAVADTTAALVSFRLGDRLIKEVLWLRQVDDVWYVVRDADDLQRALELPEGKVGQESRKYAADKQALRSLLAAASDWLEGADSLPD